MHLSIPLSEIRSTHWRCFRLLANKADLATANEDVNGCSHRLATDARAGNVKVEAD